jgi:hypothetical protein
MALPAAFLDPDVYAIHAIILGLRGLAPDGCEELLGRVMVRMNGQMAPGRPPMTPPGAGDIISLDRLS